MAAALVTTRDQLEKVLDILRRTLRYWWLAAFVTVAGGALAIGFALTRPLEYESEVVLLYREMISQSMLQDREVRVAAAALASRYREMVMSRKNIAKVIDELGLYPDVVKTEGTIAAADEMRNRISFRDKGSGTFRIAYRGDTPAEAQTVAARLSIMLKDEDSRIRREETEATKNFLTQEKSRADQELIVRQRAEAEFLTQHPEFAADEKGGGGAAIRSASAKRPTSDNVLSTLERQRNRILSRLRNPDKPITVAPAATSSAARAAAEGKARTAERDVEAAKADLAEKLRRFTDKHPDVLAARNRLAEAERAQRQAQSEVTTATEEVPAIITAPFNRQALEAELARYEREIADQKSRNSGGAKDKSTLADKLVSIEAEWAALDRAVEEARLRVQTLEAKAFTADIAASSEFAESSQLSIIDDAFLPPGPAGKSRKLIALAGLVLFSGIGAVLILGLAVVDDRIYRRRDLEELGIAPVLVVVPHDKQGGKKHG